MYVCMYVYNRSRAGLYSVLIFLSVVGLVTYVTWLRGECSVVYRWDLGNCKLETIYIYIYISIYLYFLSRRCGK